MHPLHPQQRHNSLRQYLAALVLAVLLPLTGCDSLSEVGDALGTSSPEEAPLTGERVSVLSYQNALQPDALLADTPIRLMEPALNTDFTSETALLQAGIENVRIDGFEAKTSADAGEGNGWETQLIAQPVIGDGLLFAIDARGVLSAHRSEDIAQIVWRKALTFDDELQNIEGGGLSYAGGVVYATTGYGSVVAIVASDGSLLWRQETGTPIRAAPAAADGQLYTITIDNQLLAYNARTGQPLWSHRGIRESAVYLGEIAPVIVNGIVLAPYSSGELYALRADDGSTLWSDNLIASRRTSAASALTGIDAAPIVQGNLVFALGSSGLMTASVLSNGQGLWDLDLSGHHTPWLAGNYLFILSSDLQLIALQSREKRIKWITDLKTLVDDARDMPKLASPIMLNNQLALTTDAGEIWLFDPQTGQLASRIDIPSQVLQTPVTANGHLYLIDQNARIYQY